ncbi:TRAP transporter, 4TM/12TM fusion protein [Lentibacillus halodurans]|uniref:TRAP transporter, 4TM/12TM fusion protein n=1 Tax=Lentibacillus halodurans TaxID=237679 RepID=A0A1I0ZF18_9BACI|nr:TRAP transporter fused permease subunit [Lentibacillus halodurans]SFB23982.1 TRAP transporter, 4TM/12TM fusion protein [Lentibacillus halodurans]
MLLIIKWLGITFPLFIIFVLNFFPLGPHIFRPLMLLIPAILIFSIFESRFRWLDYLFIFLSITTFGYTVFELENIITRGVLEATRLDLVFGTLAVLLVLEMTRRTIGATLPILALIFILYAMFGTYLPGIMGHGGYSYERIINTLITYQGIFGSPLAVVISFVTMFIIFAAFLELTGVGDVFFNFSKAIAGRSRGGPAKIATVSSALFGSISGSAVANVAASGSFTIPMMKKLGYKGTFAGAVESAASTGGQIMPPIMAAGAFLMAEMLGVTYLTVITAALIPAILYFITIWFGIDFRSAKRGLKGLSSQEIPKLLPLLKKEGYMLLPIIVIIIELSIFKVSAIRAAFVAMIFAVLLGLIKKQTRPSVKASLEAMFNASKNIVAIVAPVACAGIVIGVIGLTGLGGKIARFVVNLSGGDVLLTLIFAMVVAIIFGMGLPTTVAYLLVISVLSPVLSSIGVEPIAAHLFVFYFACLSGITPPVGLAAYTGANIAGAPPMRTAFQACSLAIAAFILPYLFVFQPPILMEGDWFEILLESLLATIGMVSLAAVFEGWFLRRTKTFTRIVLMLASVSLIIPGWVTDILGLILIVGILVFRKNYQNIETEIINDSHKTFS